MKPTTLNEHSTIVGHDAPLIVVDDPDGHVVPSDGVQIVGAPRHTMLGHFGIGRLAANAIVQGMAVDSMHFNMGVDRTTKIRKREYSIGIDHGLRDIEPSSRKKARKDKQRMKGLRP
jgi:hypothetical protein